MPRRGVNNTDRDVIVRRVTDREVVARRVVDTVDHDVMIQEYVDRRHRCSFDNRDVLGLVFSLKLVHLKGISRPRVIIPGGTSGSFDWFAADQYMRSGIYAVL